MSDPVSDPALLDRRRRSLRAVTEGDLPSRAMTIAGCEGRLDARILSKDPSGPATRLARMPAGWGSGVAGAFSADLEVFVVKGGMVVAGERVGPYDYVAVKTGEVISGIRAVEPTLALVMTSAPVRYDTSVGGLLSKPVVGRSTGSAWRLVPELPGRYVRFLASGPDSTTWLAGAREWRNEDGPWHLHESPEEVFVLEGEFVVTERSGNREIGAGGEAGSERTYRCGPGTYTFRLPGRAHAGPGSSSSDLAIAFHRMTGPRKVEWLPADPADPDQA